LVVRRGAMAGELADLARILAAEPEPPEAGAGIGLWNVQLVRGPEAEAGVGDEKARLLVQSLESETEGSAELIAGIERYVTAAAEAGRSDALVEPLLALDRCASARGADERAA